MDQSCLSHLLTDAEAERFERDGYFAVENALAPEHVARLAPLVDDIDAAMRPGMDVDAVERVNHYDFIGKNEQFLELLDWPTTFAKVWGLLGWHIALYHTHLTFTPPAPAGGHPPGDPLGLSWHQDSDRLNFDLETSPRPRISLKVGYFLSDTTETGRGNFYVLPGSQRRDEFPGVDRRALVDGAVPICVPSGTAVFFDRRLWHSASINHWHRPRRVLFYGYAYRWLRPRDDMEVAHYLPGCDPIRQQLLGVSHSGGRGYTSPTEADVPLKAWIAAHVGESAVGR